MRGQLAPGRARKRARAELRLASVRARKLAELARRPSLWPALRAGVVPSLEHSRVPFDPGLATVIDVGASRGQFALFALHRFPSARLLCFEPRPDAAETLARVVAGRGRIHRVALGSSPGRAELHLSRQPDSSSLLPIGERQVAEFPGTEERGTAAVEVDRLERFLDPGLPGPRLLKIDVQGHEAEVLEGAGEAISLIDEALIECSFVELYEGQRLAGSIVAAMEAAGLEPIGEHNLVRSAEGERLQADLHFRRGGVGGAGEGGAGR